MILDENLTTEQIHEKLSKLNNMMGFYRYTGKYELVEQINTIIDQYYLILEERAQIQYFEDNVGMTTGIVLDNMKDTTQEKKDEKPKRKRGFGSIV